MYTISTNNIIIILKGKHVEVAKFILSQRFIHSTSGTSLSLTETSKALFTSTIGRTMIDVDKLLKDTEKHSSILLAFLDTCIGDSWRTATFITLEE